VLAEVQAWCSEPDPDSDLFPRAQDVSCQAFLYLACGARGLVYNRFDGGASANGSETWGLAYYDPRGSGRPVFSRRYHAARTRVTPLVMTPDGATEPWGELVARLDWLGSGLADTLAGSPLGFLSQFQSATHPPWVEAGFFVDTKAGCDYLMLVNRRTVDTEAQSVRFWVDAWRLASPGARYYRVVDLNPGDTVRGEDTLIAGLHTGGFSVAASILPGGVKFFRIEAALDLGGAVPLLPEAFDLSQNIPNPFNASTGFDLSLPFAADFAIEIVNIAGQRLRSYTGHLGPGIHTFHWDGRTDQGKAVASGVYFYRARAGGSSETRKMLLIK